MRISDWSSDVCSSDLWRRLRFSRVAVLRCGGIETVGTMVDGILGRVLGCILVRRLTSRDARQEPAQGVVGGLMVVGGGRPGGTAHDLDRIPTHTREFEGGTGQDMVGGDEETPSPRRRPVGALTRLPIPGFSGQPSPEPHPREAL